MNLATFRCGPVEFALSAQEFCDQFALVINGKNDPEEMVGVMALKRYGAVKKYEEFTLDSAERESVYNALGIVVTIPADQKGGSTGTLVFHGDFTNSNYICGDGNSTSLDLDCGAELALVISGNGIQVTNKQIL